MLAVDTWLFNIDQYLTLAKLSNPNVPITDENRIRFASSYLKGTAAVWWYNRVSIAAVSNTWADFKNAVIREFVPSDHAKRARDKLRKLKQTRTVVRYLSDFRNIILTIPGMQEDEKVDRIIEGLKFNIRVEVLKAQADTLDECARVALNIDSAIWRAGTVGHSSALDGPMPMEIGNVQGTSHGKLSKAQREQRKKDMENGACFVCHKVRCRLYKCRPRIANTEVKPEMTNIDDLSDSESGEE